VGTARVTIAFDAWKEGHVIPTQHDLAVVAPRTNLKLEPVSARLRQELIHPNKAGWPQGICFSPDGKRVLAGDLPGAVIAIWDLATGKLLTTVDAGFGMRGGQGRADYFFPSSDWQTLFTWRSPWTYELVERDGKAVPCFDFQGDLRAWDLATGRLRQTFRHQPPRGIAWGKLSPDATTFATVEELPGVGERPKVVAGLWDVRTGRYRALPDGLQDLPGGDFSPDGGTLAMAAAADEGRILRLFDSATGREKGVIREEGATFTCLGFLPDGRLLVDAFLKEGDEFSSQLQWRDPATGRKVASFTMDKDETFYSARCSPDGGTVAAFSERREKWRLVLFRAPGKPAKAVPLMELAKGERPSCFALAFAPGGKWLAVLTQVEPLRRARGEVDVREMPQALVRLIDVAAGKVRETLVCPTGYAGSACFSRDGKTLATSVSGRVLLWDLTKPPLEAPAGGE
jgi:WD40 repeat protein